MSDHKPEKTPRPPRAFGWMAEYDDENKMLEAARKVRDAGYTRTDVFSPFPVHGIDETLGIKPTGLPWFTLAAGLTGLTLAVVMQIWMNAIDYPYIISGKPMISLPAFVPVMFELTVLFAAFTTVFAMLGLNGLPKFSNPVFTNAKFDRSTDDRFFLWVDSRDKYFNSDKVKLLLQNTGTVGVEEVREDDSPSDIPRGLYTVIACLILLTVIPLTIVWNIRAVPSGSPRWHVFFDMDFQPFKKAQKQTVIFADGRTERPPVPGTVARGAPPASDPYYLGYEPDPVVAGGVVPSDDMTQLVSAKGTVVGGSVVGGSVVEGSVVEGSVVEGTAVDPPDPAAGAVDPSSQDPGSTQVAASDGATAAVPDLKWLTTVPSSVALDDSLFELGEQKFNQICAVCHGYAGFGNGLVAKRAEALAATYWLQPTSVHDPRIQEQPVGQVYYTITNGKGKMGGYGSTLNVRERWAVAVYVKALQRSQNAKDSDVPAGKIGN